MKLKSMEYKTMINKNEGIILFIIRSGKEQQVFHNELEQEGFKVHITDSGIKGVEAARQLCPHLILLDLNILKMDKFEALKMLQKDTPLNNIPILILSTQSDTDDIIKSFKMGASDYVKIPFNSTELVARCKTLVSLKKKDDIIRNEHNYINNLMKGMTHDLNIIFNAMIHFEVIEKKIKEIEKKIPTQIYNTLSDDFKLIDKTTTFLKLNISNGAEIIKRSIDLHEVSQSVKSLNSIDDTVKSVVNSMKRKLSKSNIKLNLHVQKDIPSVTCNKSDIHRLIVNIIINSIFAISNIENPEITIRLWHNKNIVKISISDNGAGIPDDVLPHIFEEHYTTRENGQGMGLAIVKRIVDDLDAEISVFSTVRDGTNFTISIPVRV